ncbi:PIN domain-containing protein (plasmid) [Streptomyces sp. NBC_00536]|uniref:PIN domain-containing protein n=1 Tax=Streptomyces sp. NBC_00536 TaxID=2975769 RepID=UPI002E822DE5|nr:PIN domain-containing protein [Streptomyces sp. NBC_00536]WUC84477.1 PIN domain-containing protein [Streptomyces sp. NBC_00536]
MRLKPGYTLDIAEKDLAAALVKWQNLHDNQDQLWTKYFQTVTDTHTQLSQALTDPDLGAGLYEGQYWQLATTAGASPMLHGTLVREVRRQIAAIEGAQEQVKQLRLYAERPGVAIVYDTNALNHWSRPDEVKWTEVLRENGLEGKLARLVIPLVVIDELDQQKSGTNPLSEKAAKAIRFLEKALEDTAPGQAVEVRSDATLEVRLDPPGHRRGDPDMEILLCAAELDQLGVQTRVLSNDFGLHLRARSMSLVPMRLPQTQQRKVPPAPAPKA